MTLSDRIACKASEHAPVLVGIVLFIAGCGIAAVAHHAINALAQWSVR